MCKLLCCLRNSGSVTYVSTLPSPSFSAPCILRILNTPKEGVPNFYFDTPSLKCHRMWRVWLFLRHFVAVVSPLEVGCAPCKPCSKHCKNNIVTLTKFGFPIPQTKRQCPTSCIAIVLYVHHYFLRWKSHTFPRGINNALIGLVWTKPSYCIAS